MRQVVEYDSRFDRGIHREIFTMLFMKEIKRRIDS